MADNQKSQKSNDHIFLIDLIIALIFAYSVQNKPLQRPLYLRTTYERAAQVLSQYSGMTYHKILHFSLCKK